MRGRAGRWIAIAAAVAGMALASMLAVGPAVAEEPFGERMPQMHTRDARPGGGGTTNLIDHGGPIVPAANLYAIWWGNPASWPADTQTGLTNLLTGFGTSSYLQVARQYMRGATPTTTFGGTFIDTSAAPAKASTSSIAAEIEKVLNANGRAADPNGVYFVFTSTFPHGGNYCAWHSGATVKGVAIAQAYMPNTTGMAGCNPGSQYDGTGYSEGTRSIANVTAHELMESMTDKSPGGSTTAWIDAQGAEISDKCAWKFAAPVQIGSQSWQLQENWSNAVSGCVQQ
jgi:hypothetical protein